MNDAEIPHLQEVMNEWIVKSSPIELQEQEEGREKVEKLKITSFPSSLGLKSRKDGLNVCGF